MSKPAVAILAYAIGLLTMRYANDVPWPTFTRKINLIVESSASRVAVKRTGWGYEHLPVLYEAPIEAGVGRIHWLEVEP